MDIRVAKITPKKLKQGYPMKLSEKVSAIIKYKTLTPCFDLFTVLGNCNSEG